jgi:predicted RNA-binding protein YlqC (UPF0109 family)
MKDLLTYIVGNLVDRPDQVRVNEVAGDKAQVFEVRVAAEDLGKVIGKRGRTIRSVRQLVSAAATRQGKRAMVEVVD